MSQPAGVQIFLLNVRLAIKQVLPDATEKISWQMPTFWLGRNLIHFAAQKNHLGIYPGEAAMIHFAPRLTEYKTSKGAIHLPYKTFGTEQMNLITESPPGAGRSMRNESYSLGVYRHYKAINMRSSALPSWRNP